MIMVTIMMSGEHFMATVMNVSFVLFHAEKKAKQNMGTLKNTE